MAGCCLGRAELQAVVREKEAAVGEHELLKRRTEALMADYEQEKQVWDRGHQERMSC